VTTTPLPCTPPPLPVVGLRASRSGADVRLSWDLATDAATSQYDAWKVNAVVPADKALVPIAGHPLAEYQVSQLVRAGVDRVIVSCSAGQAALFEAKLSGLGAEIIAVAEPEPLGRGGGLRYAAERREEPGAIYAFNGDGDRQTYSAVGLAGALAGSAAAAPVARVGVAGRDDRP